MCKKFKINADRQIQMLSQTVTINSYVNVPMNCCKSEMANKNLINVEIRTGRRHVRQQSGSWRHPGRGDRRAGAPALISTSLLMWSG